MIAKKKEIKKRIELKDFEKTPEKKGQIFEISYVNRGDIVRYTKLYQYKRNVRQILEDPDKTKIKIYVKWWEYE